MAGSRAGKPNIVTTAMRGAFAELVKGNLPNINKWMELVAKDDPAKALEFMIRFAKFFIPELARTEVTGADGSDFTIKWNIPNSNPLGAVDVEILNEDRLQPTATPPEAGEIR